TSRRGLRRAMGRPLRACSTAACHCSARPISMEPARNTERSPGERMSWAGGFRTRAIGRASQLVSDRPEVGEDVQEQRFLEELPAEGAAGAAFAADGAFDELDMPIAPLLKALVEVGHQFEEDLQVVPRLVEPQQFLLSALVRRPLWKFRPVLAEELEER